MFALLAAQTEAVAQSAPPIERGTVTVSQVDRDQWHEVKFKLAFDQIPVVIMGPASFQGGDPLTFLVKDVTKQGFKYQIREWEYLGNGSHVKETFSYLAVKPGRHAVGNQLWEAGTRDFPTPGFKLIQTQSPFALTPIVLAQPIAETSVIPRLKDVTTTSFRLSLQTEEARPHTDGTPAKCGWLVVSKGAAAASGLKSFAGTTQLDLNHTWKQYALSQPRGARPGLFATVQTYKGPDPVTVRYRNFTNDHVEFRLQEEASQDPEMSHTKEEVGYLILGDVQPRDILTSGLEIGEVQTGNAWKTVTFQNEHRAPVVIPGLLSFNGPEAAIPRISEVSTTKFKIHAAEWDYLDQAHNQEKIPYLVIEDGVYTVGSGVWEAGRAFIDGTRWKKVNFRSGQFGENPLVMVGQTTLKDAARVTIRLRNVTSTGFEARLFRQESDKAVQHVAETVHFLAVDQGIGSVGGVTDYRTWSRGDANHVWKDISLPIFENLPYVFGATQTTNGIDPVGVRAKDHSVSSFNLRLQEDQSLDQEQHHIHELVGGIAIGSFSILDSDGDGLTDEEEAYGHEVIYQVVVETPVIDPVTGEETGETDTITQTHMDWVYTDPNNADSDGDGLPDKFEIDYGLNPIYSLDGAWDSDGDGISDGDEYIAGTHDLAWFPGGQDPLGGDSGGGSSSGNDQGSGGGSGGSSGDDGESGEPKPLIRPQIDPLTAWLLRFGLDPDDPNVLASDSDSDGFSNGEERDRGLNPIMADSDLDGYTDFQEVLDETDPLDRTSFQSDLSVADDGDRDGMLDSWEVQYGLDPTDERDALEDFDYDRLSNALEHRLGTVPVVGWDETVLDHFGTNRLTTPTSQRSPNAAVSTLNDLGEWFSLRESQSGTEIEVWKWSPQQGYEHVGGLGDKPTSSFHQLYRISANNFGMVAAWIYSDGYVLRVMMPDGEWTEVFSASDAVSYYGNSLEVTDSGFVAGVIRYDSNDYATFRWREGVLEISSSTSSAKFTGVSEAGEVLNERGGVVIPSGNQDPDTNNLYKAISDYGDIFAKNHLESGIHSSKRYTLTSAGDRYFSLDIRKWSSAWHSAVSPGGFQTFLIDGETWLLDGRRGFDFSRDDRSELIGYLDGSYTDLDSWSSSFYFDGWDDSFTGTFAVDSPFPEEDASLLAEDSNDFRSIVGVITYDALTYTFDGSYQSTSGFLFQFPKREFTTGHEHYFRISNAGHIIASNSYEEYWEDYDDDGNYLGQVASWITDWYLLTPENRTSENPLPDDWMMFWGISDPSDDLDGDGLNAFQEYAFRTNPHLADSDGDGVSDLDEIETGTNPLSGDVNAIDSDLDEDDLPLWKELELGTDPFSSDTDQDGLTDREEWEVWGTSPLIADHDGDGIPDGIEVANNTNPAGDGALPGTESYFEGTELVFWSVASYGTISGESNSVANWRDRYSDAGSFLQPDPGLQPYFETFALQFDGTSQLLGDERIRGKRVAHVVGVISIRDAWLRPNETRHIMRMGGAQFSARNGVLVVSAGGDTYELFYLQDDEPLLLEVTLNQDSRQFRVRVNDYAEAVLDDLYLPAVEERGMAIGDPSNSADFELFELMVMGGVLSSSVRDREVSRIVSSHALLMRSVPPAPQGFPDSDSDGLPDWWELQYGLDTTIDDGAHDPDLDTASNLEEYLAGTDPTLLEDSDFDGMPDAWEERYNLSVGIDDSEEDLDGDGDSNIQEFLTGTDPSFDQDVDQDGLPDWWENQFSGLDPSLDDSLEDPDSDFLSNLEEFKRGSDPIVFTDSDSDGMPDGWEEKYNLDSADSSDASGDVDLDLVSNIDEFTHQTIPTLADTDGDGFPDWIELTKSTSPIDSSSFPTSDFQVGGPAPSVSTLQEAIDLVSSEGQIIEVLEGDFTGGIDLTNVPHSILVIGLDSFRSKVVGLLDSPVVRHESVKTQFLSRLSITHPQGSSGVGIKISTGGLVVLQSEIYENRGLPDAFGASGVDVSQGRLRLENSVLAQNGSPGQDVIALDAAVFQSAYTTIVGEQSSRLRSAISVRDSSVSVTDSIIWQDDATALTLDDSDSGSSTVSIDGLITNRLGVAVGMDLVEERVTYSDPWLNTRGFLTRRADDTNTVLRPDAPIDLHGETRRDDGDLGADEFWDTDGDGLPDWFEDRYGLSKTDPSDGSSVSPTGIRFADAFLSSLDPFFVGSGNSLDGDSDGLLDSEEVTENTDPLFPDHPILMLEAHVEAR